MHIQKGFKLPLEMARRLNDLAYRLDRWPGDLARDIVGEWLFGRDRYEPYSLTPYSRPRNGIQLGFSAPEPMATVIATRAESQGVTPSELVRAIINARLKEHTETDSVEYWRATLSATRATA